MTGWFRAWIGRHALAGLPLLLLLLGVSMPVLADGWRVCAQEGQVCRMDGRGAVLFAVDGQWSSRVLSGDVMCNNDLFGDPAPNEKKRCEVRDHGGGANPFTMGRGQDNNHGGGSRSGWVFCAAEGETCHLRGNGEVRFGTDRHYNVRRAYGSVRCDVESFGDPLYGQTKHCEVRADAALERPWSGDAWSGSNQYDDNKRWRQCAAEGQTCYVQGRAEVRYGDGRRFATRMVKNEVRCSNSVFGDPAKGMTKHCEVRAASFGGWGDSAPSDGGWTRCANEGDRCEVSGGRIQVRYGARGRYVYRDAYGGLDCNNNTFGSDPYPGQPKQCESRR